MKKIVGYSFTGQKDIDDMLDQLKPSSQRKILGKIMKKAMKPVLNDVKAYMPVDTGETKKAVKLVAGPRKKDTIWYNVRPKSDGTKRTNLNALPKWIEFGAMGPDGQWKVEPSNPYGIAFETWEGSVQSAIVTEFTAEYQAEINRLSRKGGN